MPSKYDQFDRTRLALRPLSERDHDMTVTAILSLDDQPMPFDDPQLDAIADAILAAKSRGASVVMMMGAHVIKQGLSRFVIDLIERRLISVLACNGACTIHDYELARMGASTESVARYISEGQFGLWNETGDLNAIIAAGNADGMGLGESVGKAVAESDFPHKDDSIFAAAWQAGVPATVHVGIGYDIIHEHPNADGAALGEASYRDFLIFAKIVEGLQGGVLLNYGTAVMGPEVYLKALAMARNVANHEGRALSQLTTAVFDLLELPEDLSREATKDCPAYYYRPYKTILVRTVADGGRSFYVRGDHKATLPALWRKLIDRK
jgi:hypothetical protein